MRTERTDGQGSPFRPEEAACRVAVDVPAQPTETSCGPTCLHAVYKYWRREVPVERLIAEVGTVEGGGTIAVLLGLDALRRGFDARLYTYNLKVFDPTWFEPRRLDLADKLRQQLRHRSGKRRAATRAYLEFVEAGGDIRFEDLTPALIRGLLRRNAPILTGLSSTWLYRDSRERPDTCADDDIAGEPGGHFVVLSGYHPGEGTVTVSDPYAANPLSEARQYDVPIARLINAILLGVLTYDGNLLLIHPRKTT